MEGITTEILEQKKGSAEKADPFLFGGGERI